MISVGDFWYSDCGKIVVEGEIMAMKKHLIVLILRILETHSDINHPLSQIMIADMISSAEYPCDRKTVGRNIRDLVALGYPIVKTPKGFYMDGKAFSRAEIDFITDLIQTNEREGIDTRAIAKRLRSVLDRYYIRRKRG